MEDDMEASAQAVPDGCVGTLKKWSGWGRDRKRGTEVRKGRIMWNFGSTERSSNLMQRWVVNSRGNTKIRVTIKSASRKDYFNSYTLGSEGSLHSFWHNRRV